MAAASNSRVRTAIVLVTLASCAFFTAQGATALLSARVIETDPNAVVPPPSRADIARARRTHDPAIILRRNIFDSALGDLTNLPVEEPAAPLPDAEMPADEVEAICQNDLRLIGTVVLPGALEQSLAAIVGTDKKAGLHRGGADVEGSKIRAIQADSVILQTKAGFCRLAMFQVEGAEIKPVRATPVARKKPARTSRRTANRNAGLTDEEIDQGIEKINDTNFNISRSMLNKVLDNAGRLIGIAAVAPKVEGGRSIGMEIRGVRPNTLLTKLGIENGDILESVNGQSLTSTDAALGAYTTLRTADKFNLSIRRGDQSMIINYNLQ